MLHIVLAGLGTQDLTNLHTLGLRRSLLSKMNRNLLERERRSNMRNLFSRLFSLLPPPSIRMSVPDMVEQATLYINHFQRHLDELRQRRTQLEEANKSTRDTMITPDLNITESNSIMEVNLITGSDMKFSLCDIVNTIEAEGAEVITLTYNNAGNVNFLTIHCQASVSSRNGIESSRLLQRLRTMIEE
ncbi:transcription factor bHLH168-like [Durio zibethinus]|uniref:Transcription factor bHLH168-like n=1 Tax=Durio zibethinus TaxID=66656 RepID=A0A6P5YVL1_DURZI|nr:transcription factor bHLH168-like [Durio zibethinus]